MNNRFKTRRIFRGVCWLATAVSFIAIFSDTIEITDIFYFLVFGCLAIAFEKEEYILTNESLTIKRLFQKDATYLLDDVNRIEEAKFIIPFIRLFLASRKKPLVLLNDDIEKFVTIILDATKGKKNIVFDQSSKTIDFE